jgi:predicted DNA-binding transcriptional regulator AlpA
MTTELLDERQVAALLKVSLASVRRWRQLKAGPTFIKVGTCVRYRREDVEDWLRAREVKPEVPCDAR